MICCKCSGDYVEITTTAYKCERCLHIWPKKEKKPKTCPKCRSPFWDAPRTRFCPCGCGQAISPKLAEYHARMKAAQCADGCGAMVYSVGKKKNK
jgi:uncharacterized Zn ribbon protein